MCTIQVKSVKAIVQVLKWLEDEKNVYDILWEHREKSTPIGGYETE